jgi:hypothetical protein
VQKANGDPHLFGSSFAVAFDAPMIGKDSQPFEK